MRFTKLYEDVKASDLFKPASVEELAKRKAARPEIEMQERLDAVEKTKCLDGTWWVLEDLDISLCNLSSLKNLNVSRVEGDFYCDLNELTSLEGAPKEVSGTFWCEGNRKHFTQEDVKAVCDVKGGISV